MNIPAGHWRGTVETWLDPSAPPASNHIAATTAPLLDGKTSQIEYGSHVGENRSDGVMTVGTDIGTNKPCLVWVDTFHTGANVMLFAGGDDGSFRGNWIAGEETWRWRVQISATPDELRILHFIVTPAGEESRAIEATLRPA